MGLILYVPSGAYAKTSAPKKVPSPTYQNLFYYTNNQYAMKSLVTYAKKIDILAPQSYTVMEDGTVKGTIDEDLKVIVVQEKIRLMPLVVNAHFSQTLMHTILTTSTIQDSIIAYLVTEGVAQKYYGWQFDFEHLMHTDRDLYTAFVAKASSAFRANGLAFSIAVSPRHSDNPTDYPDGSFENWSGGFDYAKLAEYVDFISLMTYDEPNSRTAVASLPWQKKVLTYMQSQKIPMSKLSLGIPNYYWGWDTTHDKRVQIGGYKRLLGVMKKYPKGYKGWSDKKSVPYYTYKKGKISYTLWYENVHSFTIKFALVKKYHMHGFSLWVLGLEDERMWKLLPDVKR